MPLSPLDFDTDCIQLPPRNPALDFWYAHQDYMDKLERYHEEWQADYDRTMTPARLASVTDWQTIDSTGTPHAITPEAYALLLARDIRARIKAHKDAIEATKATRARIQGECRKPSQRATMQLCLELCDASREEHERAIKKLSFQLSGLTQKTAKSTTDQSGTTSTPTPGITDADIARAKDVPLTELIEVNAAGFARCPFHNERTGSFKYYKNNNTWYCFSHGEGGDIIAFVMKQNEMSFSQAVRFLNGK